MANLTSLIGGVGGGGGYTLSNSGVYDITKYVEGDRAVLNTILSYYNNNNIINTALTSNGYYTHQMVLDKVNKIIYFYGGKDSTGAESDTLYKYDINTTTLTVLTTTLTGQVRFNHRMALDNVNQKLIIYGGRTGATSLDDLTVYDIALATTTAIAGFTGTIREGVGMAFDEVTQILYIQGGSTDTSMLDDLLSYDFSAANPIITTIATAVYGFGVYYHKMVLDTVNNAIIFYGGSDGTVALDGLYKFDIATATVTTITTALTGTATNRHTIAIDNTKSYIYIYDGNIDVLYLYNITTNTIVTVSSAFLGSVHQSSQIVFDSTLQYLYTYGGYNGTVALDDFNKLNFDSNLINAKLLLPRIA